MSRELTECGYEKGLSGWLSPSGKFYPAGHGKHDEVARELEANGKIISKLDFNYNRLHGESLIEALGYIKFVCQDWGDSGGAHVFFPQITRRYRVEVKQKQWDWMKSNEDKMSTNQFLDVIDYERVINKICG